MPSSEDNENTEGEFSDGMLGILKKMKQEVNGRTCNTEIHKPKFTKVKLQMLTPC